MKMAGFKANIRYHDIHERLGIRIQNEPCAYRLNRMKQGVYDALS